MQFALHLRPGSPSLGPRKSARASPGMTRIALFIPTFPTFGPCAVRNAFLISALKIFGAVSFATRLNGLILRAWTEGSPLRAHWRSSCGRSLGTCRPAPGGGAAAGNPRGKSAWIDAVVQLGKAMAATGSVTAELKWATRGSSLSALGLRLPKLPRLPEMEEGTPPPAKIRKTTPDRISSQINNLTDHRSKGSQVKSKGGAPRGNRNA